MRSVMKTICVLLGLLSVVTDVSESRAGDYVQRDGYYWADGLAYRRYQSSYWDGCCWRYRYHYQPVQFEAAYAKEVAETKYADPVDVNAKLLGLAELKIKYDAQLKQKQQAADELQKGLQALGLQTPAASTYAQPAIGSPGVAAVTSGTTVYGYQGVNNVAALYSDGVNLDARLQAMQRTVDNTIKLAETTNAASLQHLDKLVAGRDRAALILAAANLVSAVPGSQTTVTTQAAADAQSSPSAVVASGGLAGVLQARCASCHSAQNPQGKGETFPDGVNVSNWRQFTDEQWNKTIEVILDGRMPKDAAALTPLETREFLNARPLTK